MNKDELKNILVEMIKESKNPDEWEARGGRGQVIAFYAKYVNKIIKLEKETMNKQTFEYEHFETQGEVREHIQNCEGKHMQQVAYSTFHDGLTQICFGCRKVRSNL